MFLFLCLCMAYHGMCLLCICIQARVCVCVRACVRACVHACIGACVWSFTAAHCMKVEWFSDNFVYTIAELTVDQDSLIMC